MVVKKKGKDKKKSKIKPKKEPKKKIIKKKDKKKKIPTKPTTDQLLKLLSGGGGGGGGGSVIEGRGLGQALQTMPQLTPAVLGSIGDRMRQGVSKTIVGDPVKEYRELREQLSNARKKYNNDTLDDEDIVNLWNSAKDLSSTVYANLPSLQTLLAMKEGAKGVKSAYNYLVRFLNRNNPTNLPNFRPTDGSGSGPTPPPTGGGGGSGGSAGGGSGGPSPSPRPPPPPPPPTGDDNDDLTVLGNLGGVPTNNLGMTMGQPMMVDTRDRNLGDTRLNVPDAEPSTDANYFYDRAVEVGSNLINPTMALGALATGGVALGNLVMRNRLRRDIDAGRGRIEEHGRQIENLGNLGRGLGNVVQDIGRSLGPRLQAEVVREVGSRLGNLDSLMDITDRISEDIGGLEDAVSTQTQAMVQPSVRIQQPSLRDSQDVVRARQELGRLYTNVEEGLPRFGGQELRYEEGSVGGAEAGREPTVRGRQRKPATSDTGPVGADVVGEPTQMFDFGM